MAYTVTYKDGSTLLTVADNSIDNTRTVTFIGKDYKGYGFYQNQNLVTLLTNSASPNFARPTRPLRGELWYDSTNRRLNIYEPDFLSNSGWLHAGGASIGSSPPGGVTVGDFWYDISLNVLNMYTEQGYISVATYPMLTPSGWITPLIPVKDNSVVPQSQQVLLLQNSGDVVGVISNNTFIASADDSNVTFSLANSAAYNIVQGLNIIGYIQATGGLILNSAPASSTAKGISGQVAFDQTYLYVCTTGGDAGSATWKRTQLSTF
jgi:hypothetical protein